MICVTCGLDRTLSPYRHDLDEFGRECFLCTKNPVDDHRFRAERAAAVMTLPEHVEATLRKIGVPRRLRTASWDRVLDEVREAIPVDLVRTISVGLTVETGFGLVGGVGIGKSGALAALLARHVRAVAAKTLLNWDGSPLAFPPGRLAWCDWPTFYEFLQGNAISDAAQEKIAELRRATILVLDDLGRERNRDRQTFAQGALFSVIAARNGACLPTLWTSNSDLDVLDAVYGDAVVSRLVEDNPAFVVDCTTNRRLN